MKIMKKFLFLKIFFLALYSPTIFAITCSTGSGGGGDSATYTWTQVRENGDANGFSALWNIDSVSFDDRLWVLGGNRGSINTNSDRAWSSTNGDTWTDQSAGSSKKFTARTAHTSVVFDDGNGEKIWIIGGLTNESKNDVWKSTNGKTWTTATDNAGFSARQSHSAVVFNDDTGTGEKIYVIGGNINGGASKNDVWKSANGKDWELVTSSATFSARAGHQVVKFNNKLWVIGGLDDDNDRLNDVWSSANGKDWKKETDAAGFSVRYSHAAINFDNKLWVIAGNGSRNEVLGDVWSSTDGKKWTQVTDNAGFDARERFAHAVHKKRVWILGGVSDDGFINDVWSMERD
jgi:hypothetical protein